MRVQELIKVILQDVQKGKVDTDIAFKLVKELKEIDDYRHTSDNENGIAVIGMALRFPEANDKEEYWSNIKQKKCSIHKIPEGRKVDIEDFFIQNNIKNKETILEAGYLNEIDKFDASFFKIPLKEAELINPTQRLFLEISYEAFEDAGYGGKQIYNSKTGVYVGIDHSIEFDYEKYYGQNDILTIIGSYSSLLANRISYQFNFRGPAMVIDSACSSGLVAVHQACQGLINQECDMALAGGVNLLFYRKKTALSGVESESGVVRAFDKDADGTVWGEGVGAILLKPISKAIEDGDHIYAVLKGSAVNSDGTSNGITAPNAEAQTELLMKAWNKANIEPATIGYIETHGTGTILGDPIEIKGINDAFRNYTQKRQFCAISSVKNNIGHTCGASGIASLIKTILALVHKKIPANINFEHPNKYINFLESAVYINDKFKSWHFEHYPRRAGVSAFGLSGTNCHVVVEEAPELSVNVNQDEMYVLALSAQYEEGIIELIQKYYKVIKAQPNIDLKSLCITANTGRGHYNYRFIVKFVKASDLRRILEIVKEKKDLKKLVIKDVYYGKHIVITDDKEVYEKGAYTEQELLAMSNDINNKIKYLEKSGEQYHRLLEQVCIAYIKGADVDWLRLYQGERYQKLSLPTYPYQKIRCWAKDVKLNNLQVKMQPDDEINDTFYNVEWVQKDIMPEETTSELGNILVFRNKTKESSRLFQTLKEQEGHLIEVTRGDAYEKIDDNTYIVGCDEESYIALFSSIKEYNLTKIIHLQSLCGDEPETMQQFKEGQKNGVMSLYYMTRALCTVLANKEIEIVLVSNYVNEVTRKEERIYPQAAALFGLGKVIGQEYTNLYCRGIDIDCHTKMEEIVKELKYGKDVYQVAYRKGQRFIEELHELDEGKIGDLNIQIHQDGIYIITGGMGGIGLEFSRYLAGNGPVKLALFNRTQFPPREKWDAIIARQENFKVINKILAIQEIEAKGSEVFIYSLDVTDYDAVNKILCELRDKYGKISGIIHSAGIIKDALIKNKDEAQFKNILGVKMEGTWILDKLTEQDELEFFVVFSSIASLLGGVGKGDYVAGNAYLDAYAAYRNKKGKRTLSISWPVWKDAGMAVDNYANYDGIFKSIEIKKAIRCFDKIWNKNINKVIIGSINNKKYRLKNIPITNLRSIKIVYLKMEEQQKRAVGVKLEGRKDKEYSELEQKLGNVWSDILGLDVIHIDDDFFRIGGNSILAIQMEVGIEHIGIKMSANILKKCSTIRKLAQYLSDSNHQSSSQIIIEYIIPFNEVFYKECFYNSLFPVITYFKGDIGYFFANDIILYKYDDNSQKAIKFEVEYLSVQDENSVLDACGVGFQAREQVDDVVKEVKKSIINGKPVIVWVDCFYESIRMDTYKKQHLPHTLLIYGFNDEKNIVYIVEHNNRDNLSYKDYTITYKELYDSYQGYVSRFIGKHKKNTYYEFYAKHKENKSPIQEFPSVLKTIKVNFWSHKCTILDNLNNLRKIISDLKDILADEEELKKNITLLSSKLNDIINAKLVEKYRVYKFMGDSEQLLSLLCEIIDSWEVVRAWVIKYKFTYVYQKESLNSIFVYMKAIEETEQKISLLLMQQLKE